MLFLYSVALVPWLTEVRASVRRLLCRCFVPALILLAVSGALGAGAFQPPTEEPAPDSMNLLLRLMQRRLILMHDVARWKWSGRRPIEDAVRERESLTRATERGRARRLDPGFVRSFFASQFQAAKLVQKADFDRWQAARQGPFPGAVELTSLRARIDELDSELIEALAASRPYLSRMTADQLSRWAKRILVGEGLDESVRNIAVRPLKDFARRSHAGGQP